MSPPGGSPPPARPTLPHNPPAAAYRKRSHEAGIDGVLNETLHGACRGNAQYGIGPGRQLRERWGQGADRGSLELIGMGAQELAQAREPALVQRVRLQFGCGPVATPDELERMREDDDRRHVRLARALEQRPDLLPGRAGDRERFVVRPAADRKIDVGEDARLGHAADAVEP